jgi:serine protease
MSIRAPRLLHRVLLAALSATTLSLSLQAATPPRAEPSIQFPVTRLIVKYRDSGRVQALAVSERVQLANQRAARIERIGTAWAVRPHYQRTLATGGQVFDLGRGLSLRQAARLARQVTADDPNVLYAEPDHILRRAAVPNDPLYAKQWDLSSANAGINVEKAWDITRGKGVVVAVLDTGYRPHPDLKDNLLLPGYSFISDAAISNNPDLPQGRGPDAIDTGDACGDDPSSWHGTHVAGTIGAVANNDTGIAGIAYEAKILPVRVLGKCGGFTSDIADGIIWAAGGTVEGAPANKTPAQVINLSLGGPLPCSRTEQDAIQQARSRGATIVAAAGNDGQNTRFADPANCPGVIAVAATDSTGGRASYSNYGAYVSLAAPGGAGQGPLSSPSAQNGILSTLNAGTDGPGDDIYYYYSGTSMAAPHVAGVAALLYAVKPTITPDQVGQILRSTARSFPAPCPGCGAGLLDAYAAITAAQTLR